MYDAAITAVHLDWSGCKETALRCKKLCNKGEKTQLLKMHSALEAEMFTRNTRKHASLIFFKLLKSCLMHRCIARIADMELSSQCEQNVTSVDKFALI